MAEIAVDASVLAAMAFGEKRAVEAQALLDGAILYAPSLLCYELTSVAREKIVRNPTRTQDLKEMLAEALEMDVQWVDVSYLEALELALDVGLSTYDASYLYVAVTRGLKMVTFDQRLQAAAGGRT